MSMSADMKSFRAGAKVCSGSHHGPASGSRSGPGQLDTTHAARLADRPLPRVFCNHIVCLRCLAAAIGGWGVLMAASVLLEGLQAFTPDRTANLVAALWGAGGVLAAAVVAELFMRAWRWHIKSVRDAKVARP